MSPTESVSLIRYIANKMRAADLEWVGSNKPWTSQFKKALTEYFNADGEIGTKVLCTDTKTDRQEFLLDLVVWNRKDGEGVELAVECEWSQHTDDIEQDFRKLMVVKRPLKLMMFALNLKAHTHTQEIVWERLKASLVNYRDHRKGERYMFMDYGSASKCRAWWIEIPADGRLMVIPDAHYVQFERSSAFGSAER